MAAFIPLAISAGMAIYGHYANKKKAKEAAQRSAEEQTALSGAQGTAGTLSTQGRALIQQGQANQSPAANFYRTLLMGSRGSMNQAVAAPTAAISDVYSGAERNLEHSGVRGAAREVASADLGRQRAGQISGLITGVQPAAAQGLAQIGGQQTAQGITAQAAGGNLFGNLLGEGFRNRVYGNQQADAAGQSTGALIAGLVQQGVKAYGDYKNDDGDSGGMYSQGSGPGRVPGYGFDSTQTSSRQTTPNWTSWMPQ